jgi:Flp pilus assembly protein TadG
MKIRSPWNLTRLLPGIFGSRFGEHRSAAVAVIFASMIVPICMLCALAIDYGFVMQAKSQLDLAADAAALAAARTAGAGYADGQTKAVYMAEATAAATQWFTAQAGNVAHANSFAATPVVTQNGQTFTATVSYTAVVYETMTKIFKWTNPKTGGANASIAGSSTGVIIVNAFGTVDFLLDNTSSMMLPQDDTNLAILQKAEAAWLYNNTTNQAYVEQNPGPAGLVGYTLAIPPAGITISTSNATATLKAMSTSQYCAFACHWVAGSSATNQKDYYGVARATVPKEILRFDEVQSATITAVQEMETLEQTLTQLAVGVFAFGGATMGTSAYLTTIYSETPLDIATTASQGVIVKNQGGTNAIAALASIAPPVTGDSANTNIGAAIGYMLAKTGVAGDGNTATTPRRSLLLITDGVEDDAAGQVIPSTEGPINPTVCNAIKNAGYTVYILYTPYNYEPAYLPNNYPLMPYITGATTPSILSALQSCASAPSNVIQATSPDAIVVGMKTLVDEAVGNTTRLSN